MKSITGRVFLGFSPLFYSFFPLVLLLCFMGILKARMGSEFSTAVCAKLKSLLIDDYDFCFR